MSGPSFDAAPPPASASIVIRHCETSTELGACVALHQRVWGYADADIVPLRIFVVARKIGGHVIGAFSGERLIGFAMAFPGWRAGHSYLHSHMLAVAAEYRDAGLGRRLKLAQREDALARGFDLIEWTFDPLQVKNAWLNIVKLGAIARQYHANLYGLSSSPLQGGLPTDRLTAEWWLRSRRVERLLESGELQRHEIRQRIDLPAEIDGWKAAPADWEKAKQLLLGNRRQFLEAFAQGLSVLNFERSGNGDGTFMLGKWDETWEYGGPATQ